METPSNNMEHLGQVAMDLMMYQSCSNLAKHRKESEKEKRDRKKAESGNLKSGIEPESEKPGQNKHGDEVTAGSHQHQQAEVMDICKEVSEADAEVGCTSQLSDEVMMLVLRSGLTAEDVSHVSLVCRRWWALSQDQSLRRLLSKGKVFSMGGGQCGQLGSGYRIEFSGNPIQLRSLDNICAVSVAAARRHSLILSDEGRVYSFGSGEDGKLGHGNEIDQLIPHQIEAIRDHFIVALACGVHHSLLLTREGILLSFGFAACGQLGQGDQSNKYVPTVVSGLENKKVISIAAGAHHSLAVTSEGQVYSFGLGHTGQLGHGDENYQLITYQLTPKLIKSLEGVKIVSAAAGFFNSLVISEEGEVFSFGSGGNGKLGHGDQANQLTPKQIAALSGHKVVQIAAGPCHSLALTSQGLVFSFGNGQNGRLGHGDDSYQFTPKQIDALKNTKVISIAAGESHSMALTDTGQAYYWGSIGDVKSQRDPKLIETLVGRHIKTIAAGGSHSLFTT